MELIYPEVLAFLLLFPAGLSRGVFTNLLMETVCLSVNNMTYEICSHVELIPSDVQNIIQPQVNRLLNWQVLIETILPAFCVVFLGPWSDSHGRRPLILISVLGQLLYYCVLSVQVLFSDLLPASYYLLPSIPIGLTGGYSVLVLAVVCSITDFTTNENRAARMGTFQASCMIGSLMAQLLTAKVSSGPHGFQITFLICAVVCFINLLYAIIYVPESVNLPRETAEVRVLDLFKVIAKKRPNYKRAQLYLLILANTAYFLIVFGEGDVFYQSAIKRFHWNLEKYARLSSLSLAVAGLVLIFGSYVVKFFRISDIAAALIVVVPRIVSSIVVFLAPSDHWLYVAAVMGCVCTLLTPFYRAAVTKIVPSDELGKIFAVIIFTEALVPSVSSNIYTFAYNSLIYTHPNAVFLVSFALALLTFIMLLGAYFIQIRYPAIEFEHVADDPTFTNPSQT
ncbi:hypothetical protein LSTR_LSTR003752 [Laodelphax striatellus]|uniref:Major facilitator superfamily (MFS) profile domain-containing protein n=1 Tax=Laodelphax striatellus TaxID=195883 RepID=A0A482WPZ6_LAOST|nr:hypothetical protein LSTR_LSTR003752 [Laodelphax striatellus]